jgi:cytochrome c-type biogenesis protein CcmH
MRSWLVSVAEARFSALWVRWGILGLILVVAITIGSGVLTSSPATPAQRVQSLEARLKCPSCEGLSVAESNSPSSLAVRQEVKRGVAAGESDQAIIAGLQARYGSAVLLTPPAGGLSILLWAIPVLLGVSVIAVVIIGIRRRSTRRGDPAKAGA